MTLLSYEAHDHDSWECTAVAKVDPGGNPVGMRCYNGVECPPGQACTKLKDANTGCETWDCR